MPYTILRVKKLKSAGAVRAVGEHLARQRATANADPERECRTLLGAADPCAEVQRRIADVEARIRSNAVLACEVFVGASPEFFRPEGGSGGTWDEGRLQAWVPMAMKSLTREWGAENVVSAYLHLDESTPHIQAIVVPIDPSTNRLNASHWLDGRMAMSQLQDRHAQDMKPVGLERGVRGSQATHTEVREWYGHMHSEVRGVPTPRVQAPPLQLTGSAREKWAEEETDRLKGSLRDPLLQLQTQARGYQESEKKRTEIEGTAKRLAQELEEAKEELSRLRMVAELVRGIPLRQVESCFEPEELAESGLRVGQDEAGRDRVFDTQGKVVGRNAIDLVKLATKQDFAGAVTWLMGRGGPVMAQRATIGSVFEETQQLVERSRDLAVSPDVVHQRFDLSIERGRRKKLSGFRGWSTHLRKHGFAVKRSKKSWSIVDAFSDFIVAAGQNSAGLTRSTMQEEDWDPFKLPRNRGITL